MTLADRKIKNQPKKSTFVYLAGVELDERLLPKMVLYCGGPAGGAVDKYFTQTISGAKQHYSNKHEVIRNRNLQNKSPLRVLLDENQTDPGSENQ